MMLIKIKSNAITQQYYVDVTLFHDAILFVN